MMTITQQRQQAKGECFNALVRIYHPKSTWKPSEFLRDESYSEKREEEVRIIFDRYFKRLEEINARKKPTK